MARLLAHASKIFQGFYESGSEELFPIPVYSNSRGQWLAGGKKPFGEGQPVARLTCRQPRENSRNIRGEICPNFRKNVAALKLPGGTLFVWLLFGHDRNIHCGDLGKPPFEILKASDRGHAR